MATPRVAALASDLRSTIGSVIEGKAEAIDVAIAVLLAGGHLLIEDAPGVGKTSLARALARATDCSVRRIQFTADLLPSDIIGVSIFSPDTRAFEFKPGGIFANLVIGDEINRASPKTQSALLEAMEEHRVSVDGVTHELPRPFMVIATQNPIEMHGTYPLPESQRDRFTACIEMGYPSREAELALLDHHLSADPLARLTAVTSREALLHAMDEVRGVFLHEALKRYLVSLLEHTRADQRILLGASPRAGLQWARVAQARAALDNRSYVVPEDIADLAVAVLSHRIVLAGQRIDRRAAAQIVAEIVARVPAPRRD